MLIFAHRGASGYAPENTVKAMQLALDMGASAVELDIHLVEDELYVFHDRWLDPKSNGRGLISDHSKAAIAKVSLVGEPIPTLWQLMAAMQPRPLVNIELKGANTAEPLIALYPRLLSELGYTRQQLLISSFNHRYLLEVKQALPEALVAPLVEGVPLDFAACGDKLGAFSIHLDINFITEEMVSDAHSRGLKVYVYTVDREQDILWMQQMGVDGIFTNFPDRAQQILQ
ncbi:glycerophosphodiester phosphodiesterase [Shewanella submarina]|uniref:Glycerophosphodiester phosphodiesterase n=1 Tax=Shewanella submarina TaxID=2016376 RepID=A0ABV7G6L0_9GAMM|nr:glycerophosphodiester phosphodiesterase [Shewanella submarina]MCL1038638.1 glycerophosphodiester phosphodiesterase [Shewanella submarina]